MGRVAFVVYLLVGGLVALGAVLAEAQPATTRVSVGSWGIQGNRPSGRPAISADGRWVAFESNASNLVPGDTNGRLDVFLHDRQTATTTRISVGPAGVQSNDVSLNAAISSDGRWIAFESWADNLVEPDHNLVSDVFLHDRVAGTTRRVSLGPGGTQANERSRAASISADGRWVAFQSAASNLVADDTNDVVDTFLYDRDTESLTRVSVGSGGIEGNQSSGEPAISGDGRWVAFTSLASNLVAGDTNAVGDTFVHDRLTGETTRVSVATGGVEGNDWSYFWPAISADGRHVAFQSAASNLVAGDTNGQQDIFVHDRQSGTTTRVNLGPGTAEGDRWSEFVDISADGRVVVFQSMAANLVPGDVNGMIDVFLYDRHTGSLSRVSVGPKGVEADSASSLPAISADGRWVAFVSGASNLVAGDTNGYGDTFVHDLAPATPIPPSGLAVEQIVGSLVTLRWTNPSYGPAPTGFTIEGGTGPGSILASMPTGSEASVFTFAAPAGSFYVRVHTLHANHRSTASNELRIHVGVPVAPSAPGTLLGLVNGSAVSLTWTNTYQGGAPTSLMLDVTGAMTASIPIGVVDAISFASVPDGTYTLRLRATNAAGASLPSNSVTLTVPGPCSGPPGVPADVRVSRAGRTVHIAWAPGTGGAAPTGYLVMVANPELSGIVTSGRSLSGTVVPDTYTLSVVAANPCGASAGSPPLLMVVP
jgi:Tol biopolymer transport system component